MDYQSKENKILTNPEDKLHIDTNLVGKKMFNKKPIILFFAQTYFYIKGFLWKMEIEELAGLEVNTNKDYLHS